MLGNKGNLVNKGNKIEMKITGMDEQLKRDFKALCAKRGKTLSSEIQRLMREELAKEVKKNV